MSLNWVEAVGYAGSVLVAVSLTMSSLARLRWINLAGALAFTVYGALVGAYPVLLVNAFIAVVNIGYLWRMVRQRDFFTLLPVASRDDSYLRGFLAFHAADIARHFPDFDLDGVPAPRVTFILRDMNPAGLVVYEETASDVVLHLDYVLPSYRDLQCARFFLAEMAPTWRQEGRSRIVARAPADSHRAYLARLGFRPAGPGRDDLYIRSLAP
jgi:hypothetical protein